MTVVPSVVSVALVLGGSVEGLGRRVEEGILRRRWAARVRGRRRRRVLGRCIFVKGCDFEVLLKEMEVWLMSKSSS